MNEYYSEIINGLVLSEQQHCQLENALLQRVNDKPKETTTKSEDDDVSTSYG